MKKTAAPPAGKHIGMRLNPDEARQLDAIVADEKTKAGHFATVSGSSVLVGLIRSEYERRQLGGKKS